MKLKKIRVRLEDLHHGKIVYVAHPACGIEVVQVLGKPILNKSIGSLFIKYHCEYKIDSLNTRSLRDMGVYKAYGYRRSFHTMKQAQQYIERMKNAPEFIKHWTDHLHSCDDMDWMFDSYED